MVDARSLRAVGLVALCLAILGYGWLTAWLVPLTLRVAYDPSIQYMLASLAWYRGDAYGYIDHPGTPVEVVGTLLLLLCHPFVLHASDLIAFHLARPQLFLSVAQTGVVAASLVVCAMLGLRAVHTTHWSMAVLAVAVSGLFFAAHPQAFESLGRWSHESFNFPAGTGLALALLLVARRPTRPTWRSVLMLGFGAGVLTSVQLYFAAWIVGTAVALSIAARLHGAAWRYSLARGATVAAMAALGFVVSTLPIRDRYGDLAAWVWALSSHQETYGHGAEGFSTPGLMLSNTLADFRQAPALAAALCIVTAACVWRFSMDVRDSRRNTTLWSVGPGLAAQSLVIVLLAAKHPGVKYLLPLAATLPILLSAALGQRQTTVTRGTTVVAGAAGLLGSAAFAASLWIGVTGHLARSEALARADQATEALLSRAASDDGISRQELRTLWTYGTTSPCYALWFGDETTGHAFSPDVGRLCPHDLNLSVFSGRVFGGRDNGSLLAATYGWEVALVPQDLVTTRPDAVPPGQGVPSALPSLGFGDLVVFTNPAPQPDSR